MHYETRYSESLNTKEWDIQLENGVAEIISNFREWKLLLKDFRGYAGKNDNSLTFATRTSIPWKIECELKGVTR